MARDTKSSRFDQWCRIAGWDNERLGRHLGVSAETVKRWRRHPDDALFHVPRPSKLEQLMELSHNWVRPEWFYRQPAEGGGGQEYTCDPISVGGGTPDVS